MEKIENNNFYTYGMIKPDGLCHAKEIIDMILKAGLEVQYIEYDFLTDEIIYENYPHCYGKDFYPGMKKNLQSNLVIKMLIYDKTGNAVPNYRKVLGATKSWEAEENTIRGRFGDKKIAYKNAAHGSGNEKEANEEIIRFFKNNISLMLNELKIYSEKEALNKVISYIDESYAKETIEDRLDRAKKIYLNGNK